MTLAVGYDQRAVRCLAVEAVIGVGIVDRFHEPGPREARRLQLPATLGRGPIVLVADQDQERHADVAVELRLACRIVGDGSLEPVRSKAIALLHRPHYRPAAMAMADQPDIAALHEGLRIQVIERPRDVGDARIAVDDIAAAAHVLLAARTEAVGRQHDIAPGRDQLAPRLRVLADAAAGVGEHDRRERAGAARPVEPAGDLGPSWRGAGGDARKVHALGHRQGWQQEQHQSEEAADHCDFPDSRYFSIKAFVRSSASGAAVASYARW